MFNKISFVILTWNSDNCIVDCIKGIEHKCTSEDVPYEVFVVDNGSTDGTVRVINNLAETMPIDLTCLKKNMGTTKTRNIALKKCTGEVICVLDSDTVFQDGSIRECVSTLLNDDSIGIIAPKLIFPDGSVQESVHKFPSLFGKFSRIPGIIFKLKLTDFNNYSKFPFLNNTEVDYAISACWFFKATLLDEVGYLDEKVFYAPEDIDYGIRVWKKDKKTLYYPGLTVLHHVQRLTHKKIFSRIAFSHLFGLLYYFKKHHYIRKPKK